MGRLVGGKRVKRRENSPNLNDYRTLEVGTYEYEYKKKYYCKLEYQRAKWLKNWRYTM